MISPITTVDFPPDLGCFRLADVTDIKCFKWRDLHQLDIQSGYTEEHEWLYLKATQRYAEEGSSHTMNNVGLSPVLFRRTTSPFVASRDLDHGARRTWSDRVVEAPISYKICFYRGVRHGYYRETSEKLVQRSTVWIGSLGVTITQRVDNRVDVPERNS